MEAEDWNRRYDNAELVWSAGPNQFVEAETADLGPGSALDLACGEGRNAIWLAEQGWTVTAVDFAGAAVAKGRQLAAARGVDVDWRVEDLRTLELEQRYDLVVVAYLQVPGDERRPIIQRAARAVAPGGSLLVVAHDSTNIEEGWGGPQDPEVLYSPDDLLADCAGVGEFETDRAERVARVVETDAGDRTAVDALVRLCRRGS
jgi:SAM-dependent methyltransferase